MSYQLEERVKRGTVKQIAAWREMLSGGAGRIGWKLGLGDPVVMDKLGIPAPLVGFLTTRTTFPSGTTVSLEGAVKPGIEPEVALNIGADLPEGSDREAIRGAITSLSVGLEYVDVTFGAENVEAVAAGNVFHKGVIFGSLSQGTDPAEILEDAHVRIEANGKTVRTAENAPGLEQMVDLVSHVNGTLSTCGEHLKEGDRIIAGTLTPIYPPSPGEQVRVSIHGLGQIEINFDD